MFRRQLHVQIPCQVQILHGSRGSPWGLKHAALSYSYQLISLHCADSTRLLPRQLPTKEEKNIPQNHEKEVEVHCMALLNKYVIMFLLFCT